MDCLGDCIRVFVQPLLLRQLEGKRFVSEEKNINFRRRISQIHHASLRKTLSMLGLRTAENVATSNSDVISRRQRKASFSTPIGNSQRKLLLDADMAIFFTRYIVLLNFI